MPLHAGGPSNCESRPIDDFPVMGPENSLLRHCLETLGPDRAILYNPLVLVGRPGCGKSHCLDFLERRWRHRPGPADPSGSITRWDGRTLEKEIRAALETDALHRIHQRFVAAKLLLVDALEGAEDPAVLQVFAALLDRVMESGGQVVVSLGQFPCELKTFPTALASRLWDGLLVTVRPPEVESRRALIEEFARVGGLSLDEAAVSRLATSDFPLELIRQRFQTLHAEGCTRVGYQEAAAIFAESSDRQAVPSIRRIISTTARHYGLHSSELLGPSRHKNVANARSAAIFLARRLTGRSLVEIGKTFGGRDHTTVLHSIRVARRRSEADPACQRDIDAILERLA